MTRQSAIFGVGGGGGLPAIAQAPVYPRMLSNATLHTNQGNMLPGFIGDQDVILLPIIAAGALTYHNAAGSTIFSKSVGDFGGGSTPTNFVGFFFRGALLYVFTMDTGANPDFFFTDTVDIAGTIVNIGSDQPANNNFNGGDWNLDTIATSSLSVLPHPDGTKAIFQAKKTGGNEYLIVSLADGQFTVDSPVDMVTASSNLEPDSNLILNDNGSYLYLETATTLGLGSVPDWGGPAQFRGASSFAIGAGTAVVEIGIGWLTNQKPIYYQNDSTGVDIIKWVNPISAGITNQALMYGRQELSDWIDEMQNWVLGRTT